MPSNPTQGSDPKSTNKDEQERQRNLERQQSQTKQPGQQHPGQPGQGQHEQGQHGQHKDQDKPGQKR